jgi:hypothetical protein
MFILVQMDIIVIVQQIFGKAVLRFGLIMLLNQIIAVCILKILQLHASAPQHVITQITQLALKKLGMFLVVQDTIVVQEHVLLNICKVEVAISSLKFMETALRHPKHLRVVIANNNAFEEFGDQLIAIVANRVVGTDVQERIQTHAQSLKNLQSGQLHVVVK